MGKLEGPQVGSELRRKRRTAAAWRSEGGEETVRFGSMRYGAREERGRSAFTQDWIGPTGDSTKLRFAVLN